MTNRLTASRCRGRRSALLIGLGLICGLASGAAAQEQPYRPKLDVRTPVGQPLPAEERQLIVEAILAHPEVAAELADQRVRALRVTLELAESLKGAQPPEAVVAVAQIFSYTESAATRYGLDLASGELVLREQLRGRPHASPEEVSEGAEILRSDSKLARHLDEGAVLEGGFIVDPPQGVEAGDSRHRFLQLHLLTADREEVLSFVTVDLTTQKIAAIEPPPWRRSQGEER